MSASRVLAVVQQLLRFLDRQRNLQRPILVAVLAASFVFRIGQLEADRRQIDFLQVFLDHLLQRRQIDLFAEVQLHREPRGQLACRL